MAIDAVTKKEFNNHIADYKKLISELEKDITAYKKAATQNKKLVPFFHIGTAAKLMQQINYYIDMNDKSEQMMKVKNSSYLDNGKKLISTIFSVMEKVVTLNVDEPVDFNREQLDAIKPFNPRRRLNFIKHLKRTLERLIAGYGENTKWKWSFPDLWGKLAILTKNLIDYRELQSIRDPREQFFYDRNEMLALAKQLLFDVSGEFRNKFELSTKSNNDLMMAVKLLRDLRSMSMVMGDEEMAKKAKSGIDSYLARIESDEEKKDAKAAKKK